MKSCAVQEETDSPNDVGTRALVVSRVVFFFFHAVNVERSTESDLLLRRFVSLAVYAREKKKKKEPVVAVARNVARWLLRHCYAGYLLYKEKKYIKVGSFLLDGKLY